MTTSTSQDFETETIGKLLIKQAVPASIGILVMSLNILVDTIFVGHWIGSQAIAAINVVLPVSFFHSCLRDVYWDWREFNYIESTRVQRSSKSLKNLWESNYDDPTPDGCTCVFWVVLY